MKSRFPSGLCQEGSKRFCRASNCTAVTNRNNEGKSEITVSIGSTSMSLWRVRLLPDSTLPDSGIECHFGKQKIFLAMGIFTENGLYCSPCVELILPYQKETMNMKTLFLRAVMVVVLFLGVIVLSQPAVVRAGSFCDMRLRCMPPSQTKIGSCGSDCYCYYPNGTRILDEADCTPF